MSNSRTLKHFKIFCFLKIINHNVRGAYSFTIQIHQLMAHGGVDRFSSSCPSLSERPGAVPCLTEGNEKIFSSVWMVISFVSGVGTHTVMHHHAEFQSKYALLSTSWLRLIMYYHKFGKKTSILLTFQWENRHSPSYWIVFLTALCSHWKQDSILSCVHLREQIH